MFELLRWVCRDGGAIAYPKRRRRGSASHLALALLVGSAISLSGCGRTKSHESDNDAAAPQAPEVSFVTLAASSVQPWDEFNGRINAIESVQVRARVSGYIDSIGFVEGQPVRKGQVLFVIDRRPYVAALNSAQAQLEKAHAAAQLAKTLNLRAQDLVKDRAISREETDTREANLAQALANVHAAQAAVASAKLELEYTEVRAPINAKAGKAMLTLGNLVQANQSVLTALVSQDPVYVSFDADEHSLLRYQQASRQDQGAATANPVRVGLADEVGYPHQATLKFTDNQLDSATGTIQLRAVLPNPQLRFTPGMFARVQMQGLKPYTAVTIDDKAVLTDQDRQYAYVVGKDNKAERRDLKLGPMLEGKRVVEQGLNAGDQLVVAGLQRIYYPGMPINPQPLKAPTPTAPAAAPAEHGKE